MLQNKKATPRKESPYIYLFFFEYVLLEHIRYAYAKV